jgi:hypothetical protein
VKVGFLMVGHTHEDIDQFFSIISRHLKKNHVLCPDQTTLFQEIQNAFKDKDERPVVLELLAQTIFDYVTLYRPVHQRILWLITKSHISFVLSNSQLSDSFLQVQIYLSP